jgi:hypothetical protein
VVKFRPTLSWRRNTASNGQNCIAKNFRQARYAFGDDDPSWNNSLEGARQRESNWNSNTDARCRWS